MGQPFAYLKIGINLHLQTSLQAQAAWFYWPFLKCQGHGRWAFTLRTLALNGLRCWFSPSMDLCFKHVALHVDWHPQSRGGTLPSDSGYYATQSHTPAQYSALCLPFLSTQQHPHILQQEGHGTCIQLTFLNKRKSWLTWKDCYPLSKRVFEICQINTWLYMVFPEASQS